MKIHCLDSSSKDFMRLEDLVSLDLSFHESVDVHVERECGGSSKRRATSK